MCFDPPPSAYHYEIKKPVATPVFGEEIKNKITEIYNKADPFNNYQLSVPLLAGAQTGDRELYEEILAKMSFSEPPSSFDLWIMGRVLQAADAVNDTETAKIIRRKMNESLTCDQKEIDAFATWAWGYLALHYARYPKAYHFYREQMMYAVANLQRQPNEEEMDNVQWAFVMNLLAAATAKDYASYHQITENFKCWTNKETLSDAILTIPKQDFTAWALGIARLAAAEMKDDATYESLSMPLEIAIQESPSDQDQVLAQINQILSAHQRG